MVLHVGIYDINGDEKKFPPPTTHKRKNLQITPSTRSEPPSFDIMMSTTHKSPNNAYVTIPKAFVLSNGLAGKSSLVLRSSGKEWQVKVGAWKGEAEGQTASTRAAIKTKGWSKFYADNKLKDGDLCEFELHEVPTSEAEPVIMEVYITRKNPRS